MPLIQVFIATYNRPSLVLNAIHSALNQDFDSFEVIVSDNSSNNETEILMSSYKNSRLIYRRRNPSLAALDHFNIILNEVTSDYFMLFHDDDTMCSNMLKTQVKELQNNKFAVAVGANAYVYVNNILQNYLFLKKGIKSRIINNRKELAGYYLINSIVPFPSYLYKKKVSRKLCLDSNFGGKHSDVSFLMNVCNLGTIINIASPIMNYHYHKSQDSASFDYFSRNSLIKYIINTTDFNRKDKKVLKFRAISLYSQTLTTLTDQAFSIGGWRYKKIISIMFQIYPFTYFLKIILKLIIAKSFK